MEFSIIKILDGIFISNSSVLEDYDFLFNNKVSHIVAWTKHFPNHQSAIQQFQSAGIKLMVLEDPINEFPSCQYLRQCTDAILESRQQYLCSLIFADQVVDVLPFLIAYLGSRFSWNRTSCLAFLEKRLSLQNIDGLYQKIDQLLDVEYGISQYQHQCGKLKNIQWNIQFLAHYQSDDTEEILTINTLKNTLTTVESHPGFQKKKNKSKRVQWVDMMAKNSINAGKRLFLNSKINRSLKKPTIVSNNYISSSSLAQKSVTKEEILTQPQLLPVCMNMGQQRASSAKKSSRVQRVHKQKEFDDLEYLSLKELSRTNFDDLKMKGSKMRKKQNLTMKTQAKSQTLNLRKKNMVFTKNNTNKPQSCGNLFQRSWKSFQLVSKAL